MASILSIKTADKFKEEDEKQKEIIESKNDLENYLYGVKNSLSTKAEGAPPNYDEVKAEIDPIVDEGLKWFEENSKASLDEYKNKRKELVDKIQPLLMKLQGSNPMGGMPGMGGMPEGFSPEMFSQKPPSDEDKKEENPIDDLD